jgi:peptide deformylase
MIITDQIKLRTKSALFQGTKEELSTLFKQLESELINGYGLSAIQIDIPLKVSIIRIRNCVKSQKRVIIKAINLYNAEITKQEQPFAFVGEGCLSIPDVYKKTNRYNSIEIKNGDGQILKFTGFEAVVVQHEIDHTNGILFTDREVL